MNENLMICIPYADFVEGVRAKEDLENIKKILSDDNGYCSDHIKSLLGLEVKRNARAD